MKQEPLLITADSETPLCCDCCSGTGLTQLVLISGRLGTSRFCGCCYVMVNLARERSTVN